MGFTVHNIAGLYNEKLQRELHCMRHSGTGVLFLTDLRCTGRELPHWRRSVKGALGPNAVLLLAPVKQMKHQPGKPRVGGSAIILNDFWGKRQCDWFQDDSGLGLLMGVYLAAQ